MLTLLYEFPPVADWKVLPGHCVPMFNAPARTTLPAPNAWESAKWRPECDADAAVEHLTPLAPEDRMIVFPWALHLNFPPLPQKETLTEWREEVYRRASHAMHDAENTWTREYFEPFLTRVKKSLPEGAGPTFVFDNEAGFKRDHMRVRLDSEKSLTPQQRDAGAKKIHDGILDQLAKERSCGCEEIKSRLDKEPNETIRRQCRDFALTLWKDCLVVNFGDNGTDRTIAPNGWAITPRSSVTDSVSAPVFYLSDDRLLDKCLDFAADCFTCDPRSLPVLSLVGHCDQPADVLRRLAKGLHEIGYRRAWMFNGYNVNILKDPAAAASHARREAEAARIAADATV